MVERYATSTASRRPRRSELTSRLGRWPFRWRFRAIHLLVIILSLAVIGSALAVVTSSQFTRNQYARLQQMERHHDQLQAIWSRLLLEESTWSAPSRIETLARDRLSMHVPDVNETRVMRP